MKWMMVLVALLASVQLLAGVSLNSATVEELTQLKGIGPKTAERIVKYREKQRFKDTRELMNIKGIGEKRYDTLKSDISL